MRAALIVGIVMSSLAIAHAAPDAKHAPVHEAGAYVIVIDRSSSMKGDRLELVKSATLGVIEKLDATDLVAVVSFAAQAEIVVPLGAASRRGLGAQISRIQAARGDNVAAGVAAAFKVLKKSYLDIRHVVVVTDSESTEGVDREFQRVYGVTVSAIALQSNSPALPELLATRGNGTAYTAEYLELLPRTLLAAVTPKPIKKGQAVVLLIDRSGSMQGAKLEMATEVARVCLEVLAPDDIVSVVAFDLTADVIVPPQRATNRSKMSVEVSRIRPGGGTDFTPALKEARALLTGVNAATKIVVLISDGESASDGLDKLVKDMHGEGISVSAVGLSGADRNLLTSIADAGDGRLYMVEDIGSLPRLFLGAETVPVKRF